MTSSLTQNKRFGLDGATGGLGSSPDTVLSPFAESVRVLRRGRNQAFRCALLQRSRNYDVEKKKPMPRHYQNLDFHRNALYTQSKEITLVADYVLSDKQQRVLYSGLGYAGLRRFLEEPDTAIFASSAAASQAKSPINPAESEVAEVTPQSSPGF